jgi:glycogen(starch) synthase
MLSWEYPPLVVGGLGRHVDALARELVAAGHDVVVVTRGESETPVEEVRDGVRVRRAAADPLALDFTTESLLAWSQAAEHSLIRSALPLVRRWRPDVVHAHDWLVAQSAITIAQVTGAPLVVTMHATEAGRHQGWLPRPLNLAIHSVERWLTHEAAAVITCSTAMHEEVTRLFERSADQVAVVPNGIDLEPWRVSPRVRETARAIHAGEGPLLVYAGRLVHEKGVQTLLDALPELRRRYSGLRLVVAGTGVYEAQLQTRARTRRVARAVEWAGFVPEADLAPLLAAADAVVVPSMYEPFGIVALEAAAAATPLVVAETGGLLDLVAANAVAASFTPRDTEALVKAVVTVLDDPAAARRAAARATRLIRRDYTWSAVAARTAGVYASVVGPGSKS